ncbi:MAG: hypothetical protein U9Q81_17900 [Pseudomonadota bacterium]|nr:hypothetical protein [Pseudomonadota bacterium]
MFAALFAAALPTCAAAGDPLLGDNGWEHRFSVYLWGAGLDGESGNKFSSGEVEASFSDILSNLEAGFMVDYRGKKDRWAVNSRRDLPQHQSESGGQGTQSATGRPAPDRHRVGVGSDLTWQAYGYIGYEPAPNWVIFGGYRHLYFDYQANNENEFFYDTAISGAALGASNQF